MPTILFAIGLVVMVCVVLKVVFARGKGWWGSTDAQVVMVVVVFAAIALFMNFAVYENKTQQLAHLLSK